MKKKIALKKKINAKFIIMLIVLISISILAALIMVKFKEKNIKVDTVQVDIDSFEISSPAQGYIMLDERMIDYDKSQTIIPTSEEFKRVGKNTIVAVYKNLDYKNKIDRLYEIDTEINLKLSKLPYIYSKEVSRIDREINDFIKSNKGDKSYVEMLNFKSTLDDLTYKKAIAKSKLSPSGNSIIELLKERDSYLDQMKNDKDNIIKTDYSGAISYKVDGNENVLNKYFTKYNGNNNIYMSDGFYGLSQTSVINNLSFDDIINEYESKDNSSFGIKIINNYEAYILFKFNNDLNDEYAVLDKYYTLNILNKKKDIKALLVSKFKNNEFNYYLFKVNNNVEDLMEFRKLDFKIIWKSINGFAVEKDSLKYKKVGDEMIPYVEILSMNNKIDIFVKKIMEFDDYYVVQNYTSEERKIYGIENKDRKLLRYDRLVSFRKR